MGRGLRRLILAEKFSAARRLAQILSEGMAEKVRADASSYFTFSSAGDEVIVFPLRGHIVEIDHPKSVAPSRISSSPIGRWRRPRRRGSESTSRGAPSSRDT